MHTFTPFSLNINGELHQFSRPQVMGILNVTPDSFYSSSRSFDESAISKKVEQMLAEGADMIDIGAYSSRPGAEEVPIEEEYRRLSLGLKILRSIAPDIIVSIDTFRATIARKAIEELGGNIINDISGGALDEEMFDTVAQLQVPYILMHMRGTPATMSQLTQYDNVTANVIYELSTPLKRLALLGVNDIIIDPGFGFSKTVEQNYELMQNLEAFHIFNRPILIGISRKSMITRALGITPEDALNGTTVLNTLALKAGASIIRTHDVKQAVEAVNLVELSCCPEKI